MFKSLRAMLREPLIHFLIAGITLFVLFDYVSGPDRSRDDQIIVTSGHVEHLVSVFLKTRQRQPSELELKGLIDSFILEEVLYREALGIGLNRDDTIIRRRLKQKMEFLLDDYTAVEPAEADLRHFLETNPERYRTDSRISFEQVFFKLSSREEAEKLLMALQSGDPRAVNHPGESYMIPNRFDDTREIEIMAQFGEQFKNELFALETGGWIGPVESPFGIHLVKIKQIVEGQIPEFEAIRAVLERDWLADYRELAQKELIEQIKAKYVISIEGYEAQQP